MCEDLALCVHAVSSQNHGQIKHLAHPSSVRMNGVGEKGEKARVRQRRCRALEKDRIRGRLGSGRTLGNRRENRKLSWELSGAENLVCTRH